VVYLIYQMKGVVFMINNIKYYKVVMGLLTVGITVLNLIEVYRTGSMGYAIYTGALACFATYYINKD
jgi:uncharacterized membrane protein